MKKSSNLATIAVYGFGHFYIDFICNFSLSVIILFNITNLSFEQFAFLIAAYNLLQLGTQPFFGFIMDHWKQPKVGAVFSVALTMLGAILISQPLLAVVIFGVGNAIYHVAGGLISLKLKPGKALYPGLFVGPGALGLYLGIAMRYLNLIQISFFTILTLVIGLLLMFLLFKCNPKIIEKEPVLNKNKKDFIWFCLAMLLISVGMRSILYSTFSLKWSTIWIYGFFLSIAIVLGKMLGGYLADRYGWTKIGMVGLLTAVPMLTFFADIPILAMIGAFCFNLVMPITLTAFTNLMPKYKATAFGVVAMTLILASWFFTFLKQKFVINNYFIILFLIVNIVSLFLGLRKERKNVEKI